MSETLRYLVAVNRRSDAGLRLRIVDLRRNVCLVDTDGVDVVLLRGSGCWPLGHHDEGLTACTGGQVKRICCGLAQIRHALRALAPADPAPTDRPLTGQAT